MSRKRESNVAQEWICAKCQKITVHEVVPGGTNRHLGKLVRNRKCLDCNSTQLTFEISQSQLDFYESLQADLNHLKKLVGETVDAAKKRRSQVKRH